MKTEVIWLACRIEKVMNTLDLMSIEQHVNKKYALTEQKTRFKTISEGESESEYNEEITD